ncbi:MAG TPA: SDR family oxidoreductase [Candidatus Acidoferrales bacterium]|nr:SDR family oxidoreductase [Candidatus Acidoferrales bacterium]
MRGEMALKGQKVLIVGVSKGLGYATAYALLKQGAKVVIVGLEKEKLGEMETSLKKYGEVKALHIDGVKEPKRLVDESVAFLGGIDHLSVMIGGYVEDTVSDPKGLDEMLTNHIKAPILIVREAVGHMHEGSTITLVSAMKGISKAMPNQLSYGIGKAGTAKAVQILASELAPRHIRVNAIAPQQIDGEFVPERDWKPLRKKDGGSAPPEDFANVLVWLMSEDSWIVNGAVIPTDRGYSVI